MELFQLRHFYTTAKTGNMTKAANEIMIAQPALSKSIRNLETELDTPLFTRNNKGMTLTPQGEILMTYCQQIFSLLDNAKREIHESLHSHGKLRLCLRSGSEMIGTTLSTFVKAHPDVSLDITAEDDQHCDFLIDSAFTSDVPADATILLTEEICLAVSDSHPLAKEHTVSLSHLSDEKFVMLSTSNSFMQIMYHLLEAAHLSANVAYTCNNNNMLQELISMNMGISIAASINWAHSNPPENIRLIHFEEKPCRHIYYRKPSSFRSEITEAFERNLIAHFQSLQNQASQ